MLEGLQSTLFLQYHARRGTHIVATSGGSVDIAGWGRKESATVDALCSAAKYGVVRGVDGLYSEPVEMLDV